MTAAAISTHDLGFVYPDGTRALRGVTLQVDVGELVAIIGQNGSGKSTLVRHFVGLLRATEGSVSVGGQEITDQHVADLAREVGIVFQNPDRQIFAARVRAEIAFGARNLGLPKDEVASRVAAAAAAVGLGGALDQNPYDLGYSRRKLLSLASVLAMQTPILVLDEPTTGQDERGVEQVRRIVDELHAQGRTLIAISHDMRFVAEVFDRVVVMRDGEVVLDGTPAAVYSEENWEILASTYLEPPLAARIGARMGIGSTPTEAALIEAVRRAGERS